MSKSIFRMLGLVVLLGVEEKSKVIEIRFLFLQMFKPKFLLKTPDIL